MKLVILGGFLGAGKTTLVTRMAKYLVGGDGSSAVKVVVLENEIGEVSIDDKLLKDSGFNVSTMFSGCVCCTMSGELLINIKSVQEKYDPELIILEASGVAYPLKIKEQIEDFMPLESCKIFCVADAGRWKRVSMAMPDFVHDQLDSADVIFINKIDKVEESVLKEVDEGVRGMNDTGKIYHVSASTGIDDSVWQEIFA